jgi:hypothetical protein
MGSKTSQNLVGPQGQLRAIEIEKVNRQTTMPQLLKVVRGHPEGEFGGHMMRTAP